MCSIWDAALDGIAREPGASSVVGVDLSEKMLQKAREMTEDDLAVTCIRMPIEDIAFSSDQFDVVISSLAIHYVQDFGELAAKYMHASSLEVLCCYLSSIRSSPPAKDPPHLIPGRECDQVPPNRLDLYE